MSIIKNLYPELYPLDTKYINAIKVVINSMSNDEIASLIISFLNANSAYQKVGFFRGLLWFLIIPLYFIYRPLAVLFLVGHFVIPNITVLRDRKILASKKTVSDFLENVAYESIKGEQTVGR